MFKSVLAFLLIVLFVFINVPFAQNNNSLQFNGGVVLPSSASKGLTVSLQYNYALNNNIRFYLNSGYSHWDKYYVGFLEDWSTVQQQTQFSAYTSDNHILIPVYIGSEINFNTNKFFTAYAIFELGYSYLSYNTYSVKKEINPSTGEVISYYADRSTRNKVTDNLFGLGAGIGLLHQLSQKIGIIFSFKLNSQLNSKYNFINGQGTYTAFSLGLDYKI